MLNRILAPPSKLPSRVEFPIPEEYLMPNRSRLLVNSSGNEEVCRVDILLHGGSRYQSQNFEARAAVELMAEGAGQFTSAQISNHFDFLGSFLEYSYNNDYARITAYSLNKHLERTLDMLEVVLKSPTYPADELNTWSSKGKQNLIVMLERPSSIARRLFIGSIYGMEHPYGKFASPEDFDSLTTTNPIRFHSERFGSENSTLLLSGRVGETEVKLVEKFFGEKVWGNPIAISEEPFANELNDSRKKSVVKPNALQTAICIGRELFTRNHPDHPSMSILSTILGGYFGSRLMKNIREDKGYSYGISSGMRFFRDSGYLIISTEVGSQYTANTLHEIYAEIDRLCNEPVSKEELDLVRSHLMGQTLRNYSNPFAVADNIIGLYYYNNLDYNYLNRVQEVIHTITPKQLQDVAQRWLGANSLVECYVGPEQ